MRQNHERHAVAVLAVVGTLLLPHDIEAQVGGSGIDVVAVGTAPGHVFLATPTGSREWRVRDISLGDEGVRPMQVSLAPSGSKLALALSGGTFVADLTTKIPVWHSCAQLHTLPAAHFALVRDGAADFRSDQRPRKCSPDEQDSRFATPADSRVKPLPKGENQRTLAKVARGARVSRTGSVAYWTTDNELHELRDAQEVLVRRNWRGNIVDLIPSATDGPLLFALIAVGDGRATAYGVRRGVNEALVVDESPLAGPSGVVEAQMAAALYLSTGSTLRAPEFILPEEYRGRSIEWSFWPVSVDPMLYAPVLQFDESEQIRPHLTTIWSSGEYANGRDLIDWYSRLRERRPSVYHRVSSYPGSWLIEYWTYYPIDNGHVKGHPHDTEHVFVEVDKLGAAPRAVLAAAHIKESPNNLYSSLDPDDAEWPTLPLFVFVELGKHAMSPDVNRDGVFTFGRDVNSYREIAHVWGIRDYIGRTDDHWNAFRESMTVPRRPQHRMHAQGFLSYFPQLHRGDDVADCDEKAVTCAYGLATLPARPRSGDARERELDAEIKQLKDRDQGARFYEKEAERELLYHSDALVPERIYKTAVFPDMSVRVGLGHDFFEPAPQVSVGLAVSLMRPFGWRLGFPIAGRLAAEFLANRPRGTRQVFIKVVDSTGLVQERLVTRQFGASKQLGLRYERMTSNMFGFFFGVHRQFQSEITRPGSRLEGERSLGQTWFRLGPMFEFRKWGVQAGPAWNWEHLEFEIRGTFVLKAWKGRSRFGITH